MSFVIVRMLTIAVTEARCEPKPYKNQKLFFSYFYCLRCSKGVFDEKRAANFILLTGYRQKP